MRIAIIGGGFTGLAAAYELSKAGHSVTLFEKEKHLGGLAYGFKEPQWRWHIEAAYHHLFTNDHHIINLVRELGLADKLIIKRPITATLWRSQMYQLDSPFHLLAFPGLSIIDKFRTGAALACLKIFPFWKLLEGITAEQFLVSIGGVRGWKTIWEPLLYGKFGDLAPTVAASWFMARIKKRTPSLCYIAGGFHTLVAALETAIKRHGGKMYTGKTLTSLPKGFDRVLLTVPTPIALKLVPDLAWSIGHLASVPHLHAQTLILETDRPILRRVYWLNVTDRSFPFLAAVAHTNFMEPKYYGGRHLTYFGNYLPQGHQYLSMTKEQLLKKFMPFIKRLSHNSLFTIHNSYLFVGPFAQPVHELHYSQKIPPIQTPLPDIYLANMDFVVPWDRGTNYAVALGIKAAKVILSSK